MQDLVFEPTSMTVSHGYVAAGGQASQLDIREAATGAVVFKGRCGGSVNNALHIAKDASHTLKLHVCNNDDTVKIFSLSPSSATCTAVVRCPVAINYCAVSPDGYQLAAVGDNRHCYVYSATPSGYRNSTVLSEATDAGMCCAWSPGGGLLATASQDGLACVWDHRSGCVVAKYHTPLACRNIKFSPAPLDLMAFTEHRGRCHLVDTRMWSRHQILHVGGSPELEPDISGLAFSPEGRTVYVGTEDGVVAYSVDTVARRGFPCAEVC